MEMHYIDHRDDIMDFHLLNNITSGEQ